MYLDWLNEIGRRGAKEEVVPNDVFGQQSCNRLVHARSVQYQDKLGYVWKESNQIDRNQKIE